MRKLSASESRLLAVIVLLVVAVLAYLLLVQWWFAAPLGRVDDAMQDLRQQQQRYAGIVAEQPELRNRLAALEDHRAHKRAFFSGKDASAATVHLMQRVVSSVDKRSSLGPCKVTQKMPVPSHDAGHAPYRKVSANINMRCDMQALAAVLYDLGYGQPDVFVDNISVYRNGSRGDKGHAAEPLAVHLRLYGYMRNRTDRKAEPTP